MPKFNESTEKNLHDELGGEKVSDEGIVDMSEEKGFNPEKAEADSVDTVDKAADAAPKAKPLPKTKAGMIQAAYDKMSKMKKDDLKSTLEKWVMEAKENEEEDDDEEDVEDDESEMSTEKYKKEGKKKSMKEDLQALVDSEATLSEGFKEKAEVIFEAAVSSKVADHVERLEESYRKELSEEVDKIHEELVDNVHEYLNYVVESWMEDNKLAIENGLRAEIAESFMGGLKSLFEEHYVEVPDSKVDVVDEMAKKVDHLEEELSTSVNRAIRLNEKVKELTREKVIREAANDLTETQAEKLRGLVEDLDFDSEDTFEKKVETVKESYFKGDDSSSTPTNQMIDEDTDLDIDADEETNVSGSMARYLDALRRSDK